MKGDREDYEESIVGEDARSELSFEDLIISIRKVHEEMAAQAGKAVNICLTLRNWVIGCHIREYEQKGKDRAEYGTRLLEHLALELQKSLDRHYSGRYLRLCRQFYETYPQIRKSLISRSVLMKKKGKSLISALVKESEEAGCLDTTVVNTSFAVPGTMILERLSFTHIVELMKLDDSFKRVFYENQCMTGNWSVRELKRQIASLYYERSGLSRNKKKLAELAHEAAEHQEPQLPIRDPYVFEFLGLKPREVMGESDLEDALIDKLQEFLLEMGHGFCFEARQKRILIGDEYFFVDLVFYHRILKCHVLLELKLDRFAQKHLGQINTYLNWFKKNEMTEGDNPPVGILLCTDKNHALVEYALAGMDNQLFISKYQLELPNRDEMRRFLEQQIVAEWGNGGGGPE